MTEVIICTAIIIAAGLLACFFGQKLFSISIALFAFQFVFEFVTKHFGTDEMVLVMALAASVVAVLMAQYAKKTSFFLIGMIGGAFLGIMLDGMVPPHTELVKWGIIIGSALVFGILCAHWDNLFIRLATAFLGGRAIACALVFLTVNANSLASFNTGDTFTTIEHTAKFMTGTFADQYAIWILVIAAVLTIVGYRFQKKH